MPEHRDGVVNHYIVVRSRVQTTAGRLVICTEYVHGVLRSVKTNAWIGTVTDS
jgi:hypothetical protein